jgi:hypothetical protein
MQGSYQIRWRLFGPPTVQYKTVKCDAWRKSTEDFQHEHSACLMPYRCGPVCQTWWCMYTWLQVLFSKTGGRLVRKNQFSNVEFTFFKGFISARRSVPHMFKLLPNLDVLMACSFLLHCCVTRWHWQRLIAKSLEYFLSKNIIRKYQYPQNLTFFPAKVYTE